MKLQKFSILFFVFLFSLLFLGGCQNFAQPISQTGFFFNTVITLTVYEGKDSKTLEGAFDLCEKYENMLSRTVEGSDIYRLNHSNGEPVTVSEETAFLLGDALSYAEVTEGRIDPTVAPLMDLWDFTSDSPKQVPSENEIKALLPHVNYKNIKIDGNTVTITDTETQVDLGFIAKGYIADKLKEYFISQDVAHALINLGGNVLTLGGKPDGSSFKVGIQTPFESEGTPLYTVEVKDQSLVSSGNYERYFEQDGVIYHHILNPSTGYPYQNDLLEVTILSSSSMQGDALSTTCYALGLEEGMELIESIPDVEAAFVTKDYVVHKSSGFPD